MRITLLTATLLISLASFSQDEQADSLKQVLEAHSEKDTVRFRLLVTLSDMLLPQPAESKRYLLEAHELAKELKFEDGIAESYCSLAHYFWNLTEFPKALEYGLLALRGYEKSKNPNGLYETYNTLAGIHSSLGEFDKASNFMDKMLAIGATKTVVIDYGELYHNMAWLKLKQNQNQEGLDLINKALDILAKEDRYAEVAQAYFLRAKAGQALNKLDDALRDFQRCIQFNKSFNPPSASSSIAAAHEGIGGIYIAKQNSDNASRHLDTAMSIARQIKSQNLALKIYAHRVSLFEGQKNFQGALEFERLRNNLRDSIFNIEKSQQLAEVSEKYETEKKEQAIQILQRDKKIQILWRNLLLGSLTIVLCSSLIVIFWLRHREKENKKHFDLQVDYLTAQHQELSLKYNAAVSTAGGDRLESQDQRFLKKALEIVERHISDPLFGVEKLAEELAMTRVNLHRKLKSLTGITPSDFIRNIRLKRAASLLAHQTDTISQIGLAVGFEDQSYFSKAFKKHFGVAPSDYGLSFRNP